MIYMMNERKDKMKKSINFSALGVVVVCAVGILFGISAIIAAPLFMIWVFNSLFDFAIEYSILNWFVAFVLMAFWRNINVSILRRALNRF